MSASLEKDGCVITKSILEPKEKVVSARVERTRLSAGVAKGDSSDYSLFVPTSSENNRHVITTSIPEATKAMISDIMGKNELATEVTKNGFSNFSNSSDSFNFSNSSDSSIEKDLLESDSGSKSYLIIKSRRSSQIIALSGLFFVWVSNIFANGTSKKHKRRRRHNLLRKKLKPNTIRSLFKYGPNLAKTKPKLERASKIFKENIIGKNTAFNSGT